MCDGCKSVHEDFSGMSQYLTEAIDSSMCVRFTLARVNGRTERTTEMMQKCKCTQMSFLFKNMLVTKIFINSTGVHELV